jgi:prolyl oligopeptidase
VKNLCLLLSVLLVLNSCAQKKMGSSLEKDKFLWLEDVEGEKALKWVKEQNALALNQMTASTGFKTLQKEALNILEAKDKIPFVKMQGNYLYNFWQDDKSIRGLWRRTTLDQYKKKKVKWETVLDLDQLAKDENENWVFKGAQCLAPQYKNCLINLSRGGKDAVVVREFDVQSKTFVKNGFSLKEAKSFVEWIDKDTLIVATDFGADSLTDSGYPRTAKLWQRGQELSQASQLIEVEKQDMTVNANRYDNRDGAVIVVQRLKTFYTSDFWLLKNGELKSIPIPDSAEIMGYFKGYFLFKLRDALNLEGKSFSEGSLVAVKKSVSGEKSLKPTDITLLYEQDSQSSILNVAVLKDKILINSLDNVKGAILEVQATTTGFSKPQKMNLASQSHLTIADSDSYSNSFFYNEEEYLKVDSLYFYDSQKSKSYLLKSLPQQFKTKGMIVEQKWATSLDGTKIPYFIVGKKSVIAKGNAPTLLYGYGGFEISMTPRYNSIVGKLWLEKGGVYVVANIRGGGEFGPKWHQAALKTNRHKAYEDFIAVGEDLIKSQLTTKEHLAIQGGSNGGLLVGAVMVKRPDLFRAVLCHVPLLDMLRYSQLLAGASWMGEYGDPSDSKMRQYILTYSPYQNLKADVEYPEVFFLTSTKDDRVHPGHARKMAAMMLDQGHKKVHYYENTEGGHSATANLKQSAKMRALTYEFLFNTIGKQ